MTGIVINNNAGVYTIFSEGNTYKVKARAYLIGKQATDMKDIS